MTEPELRERNEQDEKLVQLGLTTNEMGGAAADAPWWARYEDGPAPGPASDAPPAPPAGPNGGGWASPSDAPILSFHEDCGDGSTDLGDGSDGGFGCPHAPHEEGYCFACHLSRHGLPKPRLASQRAPSASCLRTSVSGRDRTPSASSRKSVRFAPSNTVHETYSADEYADRKKDNWSDGLEAPAIASVRGWGIPESWDEDGGHGFVLTGSDAGDGEEDVWEPTWAGGDFPFPGEGGAAWMGDVGSPLHSEGADLGGGSAWHLPQTLR